MDDGYRPVLDERKFRHLVLYITQRSWQDASLGRTKLWKILWLSDFLAFLRTGRSVTGSEYLRFPLGPVPEHGLRLLQAMEDSGEIETRTELYHGYRQYRPLARGEPDLRLFTAEEIAVVEEACRQFADMNATEAVRHVHAISAGWSLTPDRERIPYETALLSPEDPTEDDIGWARELAAQRGA